MDLIKQLDADMKVAAKARDKVRLSTIRMVRAEVKNREIAKKGELVADELLKLVATLAKQRRESIEQFAAGGRDDLVAQETAELAVLESYLPQPLGEDELKKVVEEVIAATGATGKKDMGAVMQAVMPKVAGRADGKAVNKLVASLLP